MRSLEVSVRSLLYSSEVGPVRLRRGVVRIRNQPGTPIYNAPVVAFDVTAEQPAFCDTTPDYSLVHDRVLRICPEDDENGGGTVTIALTPISASLDRRST